MTDLDDLEKKVDGLITEVDYRIENEQLKADVDKLKREKGELERRIKPNDFGRAILDIGKKVVDFFKSSPRYLYIGIFLSGIGYCGYSCYSNIEEEKESIKLMFNDFVKDVNQKDTVALEEYFYCYEAAPWQDDIYTFMEGVRDKVLNENYVLEELKIVKGLSRKLLPTPDEDISTTFYNANLEANFSPPKQNKDGLVKIRCTNKCKFVTQKSTCYNQSEYSY